MGKLQDKILILGEGITEFYYFNSLRDVFKGLDIQPDFPKHTSLKELDKKIEKGAQEGYGTIYCVIDMDTKSRPAEAKQYQALQKKYEKTIDKPKKGIHCEVKFFETELCTEMFFLYYFRYTTRQYAGQEELIADLNAVCGYEKNEKFFRGCKGLHAYFEKKGGSLEEAIKRANRSSDEHDNRERDYSYSELGKMLEDLKVKYNKK